MQAKNLQPAEVFHPGKYLRDELQARGWTQKQFAQIIDRPLQTINGIINGKVSITAATAKAIAAAFGTTADLWLSLQVSYDLFKSLPADPAIRKRAMQAA
jgi:HTH-type transcriptional regulator/antitoxin HigA